MQGLDISKKMNIYAHISSPVFFHFLFLDIWKKSEKGFAGKIAKTFRYFDFNCLEGIRHIPVYSITEITDILHDVFEFRVDRKFASDKTMKKILGRSKTV